jgi:hypothetical protein
VCAPQPLPRLPTHFPHFTMIIAMGACGSGCGGGHVAYARASSRPAGFRKPGTRARVGCFLHPSRHWASQCGPSPLPYIAGIIRKGVRWAQGQPGPAVRRCRAKSCSAGAVTWIPHTFLAGATWLVGPLESGWRPHAIPLASSLLVCLYCKGRAVEMLGVLGWSHTWPSCGFWAGGLGGQPPHHPCVCPPWCPLTGPVCPILAEYHICVCAKCRWTPWSCFRTGAPTTRCWAVFVRAGLVWRQCSP